MKKKIGIIGSFGFGCSLRDGQTIKTKQLASLLKEEYGSDEIREVDTHGWKKKPWRLFFNIVKAVRTCECVIMLPASGALKIIPRLALAARCKKTRLYYDVIGGFLPTFLSDKPALKNRLKQLNGIWVETAGMKTALESEGFNNVDHVRNFKDLNILELSELPDLKTRVEEKKEYTFTIFSRIMLEKGIEDAIEAVESVNRDSSNQYYAKLDLYGQIEPQYETRFKEVLQNCSDAVEYQGVADPEDSVRILKDTYMLLFPTHYKIEGMPGTIIDAYSAGVPVVVSDIWNYSREVVKDGILGIVYDHSIPDALKSSLHYAMGHPEEIQKMKIESIKEAEKYAKRNVAKKILHLLK